MPATQFSRLSKDLPRIWPSWVKVCVVLSFAPTMTGSGMDKSLIS